MRKSPLVLMSPKALLLLAALFSLALYANVSANPSFIPLHLDEYQMLSLARESIRANGMVFHYGFDESQTAPDFLHSRFESSFQALVVSLLVLLPVKPTAFTLPFTVFVSFLFALAAFVFSREVFGSWLGAFIMGAGVLFVPNTFALLGYAFMVPMALAMALMPMLAFLFARAVGSLKYAFLFLVALANAFLVHAPFALVAIAAAAVFLAVQPRLLLESKPLRVLAAIAIIAALALLAALSLFVPGFAIEEALLWEYRSYTARYPLPGFVGIPALAFAALGLAAICFCLAKKRFSAEQRASALFLLAAVLTGLGIRLFGDYTGTCLLGPCRRTTLAFLPFVFVLAGAGFYAFVSALLRLFGAASPRTREAVFLCTALAIAVLLPFALGGSALAGINKNYLLLDRQGIRAAEWLSLHVGQGGRVFALPWDAQGVSVVSGMNVYPAWTAFKIDAVIANPDSPDARLVDFFFLNCGLKEKILSEVNAAWVFSPKHRLDCPGISKVYQGSVKNHAIYRMSQ
jgi:hypothetical protein